MPSETTNALQRQLLSAFSQPLSTLPDQDARDCLAATEQLCTSYHLSAEDLFFKWEAFSMDNALLPFSPSNIDPFRQSLSANVHKPTPRSVPTNVLSTTRRNKGSLLSTIPGATPSRQSFSQSLPATADVSMDTEEDWSAGIFAPQPITPTRSGSSGPPSTATTPTDDLTAPAQQASAPTFISHQPSKQDIAQVKAWADRAYHHTPFAPDLSLSFHSQLDARVDPSVRKGKAFFSFAVDPAQWNYRYMFAPKKAVTSVLDDKIEQMAAILAEYYNLDGPGVFHDPSVQTQQDVYTVGRVVPLVGSPSEVRTLIEQAEQGLDGGAADWIDTGVPKLGDMGVGLEVSKRIGDGDRVKLTFGLGCKVRSAPPAPGSSPGDEDDGLERTDHISFFPGMLVGLRGRNGTGSGSDDLGFVVSEILLPPRLPSGKEEVKKLRKYQLSPKSMNGQPLKVVVAAGPFTSASDLLFQPLAQLAQHVVQESPDVLVLLGPILSREHKVLQEDPEVYPEEAIRTRFSGRLKNLLASVANLRIAIVPSTDDYISSHLAYPQPALSKDTSSEEGMFDVYHGLSEDRRLILLPNPCALWINECLLGLSTADVLRDMGSQEVVINLPSTRNLPQAEASRDPILRSFVHVISQRCFYPLTPSVADYDELPLAVDVAHMHLADFVSATPDLLILPSSMPPVVKEVSPTICLNPGHLGGRTGDRGGSFATVMVTPMEDLPSEDGQRIDYGFADRCRIDMLRL